MGIFDCGKYLHRSHFLRGSIGRLRFICDGDPRLLQDSRRRLQRIFSTRPCRLCILLSSPYQVRYVIIWSANWILLGRIALWLTGCMYVCVVIGLMVKEAQGSGLTNMLSHDVLFNRTWPGAYTALTISCGYFAYDQWDMIRKHLYSAKAPHLLVHHAVLLTCFTPALQRDLCINYLILTLICEVCNRLTGKP